MNPLFNAAQFLKSTASVDALPAADRPEVAFAGRSNAGKSSALNTITARRGLARVSKTPGRTQLINFFAIRDAAYLVDLPGYGFAQAPEAAKDEWSNLVENYLQQRTTLRGIVLLMDVRHPLADSDRQMVRWSERQRIPLLALLTKADKLSRQAALRQLGEVSRSLPSTATVQLFSATAGTGVEEVCERLAAWLDLPDKNGKPKKSPEGRGGPSG
jgi:GTP-binding protein